MRNEYVSRVPITQVVQYSSTIPFYRSLTISEHTLISNDILIPITGEGLPGEFYAVPGYGTMYRLIGDGVHSPVFNSSFKQVAGSNSYNKALGVVNLITFLYDGVDFWYTIVQVEGADVTTTPAPTTTPA